MQILTNSRIKRIQILIRLGKYLFSWTVRNELAKVSSHIGGNLLPSFVLNRLIQSIPCLEPLRSVGTRQTPFVCEPNTTVYSNPKGRLNNLFISFFMQRNIPHHDLGISKIFLLASDLPGYLVSNLNLINT